MSAAVIPGPSVLFTFGGLEPGTKAECSIAYESDEGPGCNVGVNARTVNAAGTVTFESDWNEITCAKMLAGKVHAWAHASGTGTDFSSPPLETNDGPAELTFRFPPETVAPAGFMK